MQAINSIPLSARDKKLFQLLVTFLSLKLSIILIGTLALLVTLLYVLYLLVSACFDLCEDLAQVYGACNPLEKILIFVIAWAFIAWVLRVYRSFKHGI